MSIEINFFSFFPWLYVGNQKCSADISFITDKAITHIVNCASNQCSSELDGITYHEIPLEDDGVMSLSPFVHQASQFINDAQRSGGVILIHCELGRSRSVSILIGFLILEMGMSFRDALNKVTSNSAYANPTPVFKSDLIRCWNASQQLSAMKPLSIDTCFPETKLLLWEDCRKLHMDKSVAVDVGYSASGRWGYAAAGVMIISQSGDKVLLLKRSNQVEEPGVWSTPGGALKNGDTALQTAIIELQEEAGYPTCAAICTTPVENENDGYVYSTYLMQLPYTENAYFPRLNWEHDEWRWFGLREILYNTDVHPGVKFVVQALIQKSFE